MIYSCPKGTGIRYLRDSLINLSFFSSNSSYKQQEKHIGSTKISPEFVSAKLGYFAQTPPHQENLFTNGSFLKSYLKKIFPKEVQQAVWPDLIRFGERCVTEIYTLGRDCELNPPYIKLYNAWGHRTDELVTCDSWKRLKDIAAEEGLIATAYENKFGEYDRVYQMLKLYLFSPVSGLFSCPLAMTDGAAKTAVGSEYEIMKDAFSHLTSRDPSKFWTSGQWMTERKGGSDVSSATESVAFKREGGYSQLYGIKWFSSATDSDMALTLANFSAGDKNFPKPNSLTMFFMKVRDDNNNLNNIEIIRLKDKLGTRQLPTAELLLDGSIAHQVGDEGRGVANIANMLTITRMHNTIAAISLMRRVLSLVRDYSHRRTAFGKHILHHPLQQVSVSRMEVICRGCEIFTFHLIKLLGREEANTITETESRILRLLTPVAKLYTGKLVMNIVSEAVECFGGQGYMEDSGIPALLRDAQVLPIWEGTTNIMSLDVLRANKKARGKALPAVLEDIRARLSSIESAGNCELESCCSTVKTGISELEAFVKENVTLIEHASRDIAFTLANVFIASLLIEHAAWHKTTLSVDIASRWCLQPLCTLKPKEYTSLNNDLIMDGYDMDHVHGPMF